MDSWPTPDFPTALALCQAGGAIVALNRTISLFDLSGRFEPLCTPEPMKAGQRLNEGRCDPDGRFWVGSMKSNLLPDGTVMAIQQRSGSVYCISTDGSVGRVCADVFGIPNTMIWTTDGRFLIADSMRSEIYVYDYLADEAQIANRRLFSRCAVRGVPDGSALDREGGLWNARFGGGCIVRFDPSGEVDRLVELPATNPTSCAFGGPNLDILYITTASPSLSAAPSSGRQHPGELLAIEPGVRGAACGLFAGCCLVAAQNGVTSP